jgi:hypothetical protein
VQRAGVRQGLHPPAIAAGAVASCDRHSQIPALRLQCYALTDYEPLFAFPDRDWDGPHGSVRTVNPPRGFVGCLLTSLCAGVCRRE